VSINCLGDPNARYDAAQWIERAGRSNVLDEDCDPDVVVFSQMTAKSKGHGNEMDAEKFDWIARNALIWGIGGVALILALQKYIF
jgi:hypothetical protein